jgi:hypothetical protein
MQAGGGIHNVGRTTLSTRLCAICLGAALACAQLLCGVHKAEAVGHKPGEVCELCLSLANVDHALIAAAAPPPAHGWAVVNHRSAWRAPRAALVREVHARSPPSPQLIPLLW